MRAADYREAVTRGLGLAGPYVVLIAAAGEHAGLRVVVLGVVQMRDRGLDDLLRRRVVLCRNKLCGPGRLPLSDLTR